MNMKSRIRKALEDMDLPAQRIADVLGYSRASVSSMLTSPGDPPVEYIKAAVELTGYSYHWFITGEGDKTSEVNEPHEVYGSVESRLLALMKQRKKIDEAIAALLESASK
jgi:transcriptional regulator with XRE-family HTH domain